MPYNDKLKTIFLHIPKTGGTAVKRILGIKQFNSQDPNLIPSPQHLTCSRLRIMLGDEKYDSYFKFTFVRNPWSRLVSEYFWRKKLPRRRTEMDFGEFAELAAATVRGKRYFSDHFGDHFIPQFEYTTDVDRVFRFESFAQGVASVARKLGVETGEIPAKPVRAHDKYWEFYDERSQALVHEIYRGDIEAFGYEFEG